MSANNKQSTKTKTGKTGPEAKIDIRLDKLKNEIKADTTTTFISFDMKLSDLTSSKPYSSSDQPSTYLIKWPLLKSPGKYLHASKFNKHLSSMNLECNTLLQI